MKVLNNILVNYSLVEQKKLSISDFPKEMVEHIFFNLNHEREIARASCVSKQWYQSLNPVVEIFKEYERIKAKQYMTDSDHSFFENVSKRFADVGRIRKAFDVVHSLEDYFFYIAPPLKGDATKNIIITLLKSQLTEDALQVVNWIEKGQCSDDCYRKASDAFAEHHLFDMADVCVQKIGVDYLRKFAIKRLEKWRENAYCKNESIEKEFGIKCLLGPFEFDSLAMNFLIHNSPKFKKITQSNSI